MQTHTKHVKEYFGWLHVLAPLLALAVAYFVGIEDKVSEFIVILAAMAVNFLIIWRQSTLAADDEQSPVRSFLTNDLLPNQSGKELLFHTEVAIIEAGDGERPFNKSLWEKFKTEVVPGPKLKRVASDEPNLIFRALDIPASLSEKDDLRKKLMNDLSTASAVVVVREKKTEDSPWVYQAVDDWAYSRSDVPILFTKLDRDEAKSTIPDKYFSIPKDAKSLPWRLLQRANERAYAWRNQASFNRLVATNFIVLLVMSFLIGHFIISHLEDEKREARKSMFTMMAEHTKEQYKRAAPAPPAGTPAPDLHPKEYDVSYWFRHKDEVQQLVTTEQKSTHKTFDFDKHSAIGSAFVQGNHVTEWNNAMGSANGRYWIQVRDVNDEAIEDTEANFYQEQDRAMTSIVCSSYNSTPTLDPDYTVGICVFTQRKEGLPGANYQPFLTKENRDFLRDEARKLFERTRPLIQEGELAPYVD